MAEFFLVMLKMEVDQVISPLLSAHVLERQIRKMNSILETSAASHCFIESSFYSAHTSKLILALMEPSTVGPPSNVPRYILTRVSLSEWFSS